jgi:hypothetical protein
LKSGRSKLFFIAATAFKSLAIAIYQKAKVIRNMQLSKTVCALILVTTVGQGVGPSKSLARREFMIASEEPDLPAGLGDPGKSEPALPGGLESKPHPEEPVLPRGMENSKAAEAASAEGEEVFKSLNLTGFLEARGGIRTQEDPYEKDASLAETRLQLEMQQLWKGLNFRVVSDFLYDPVLDRHGVDFEEGEGWVDLRQANAGFTPLPFMDVKAGRQILTWGTGDLLFLNDLFPKDWRAFFIGRDVEYLKAPSDAIKVSLFGGPADIDLIYTPRFDSDRYLTGIRLSYHNNLLGRRAGRDAVVRTDKPDSWFRDDEWAVRLSRNLGGYELAAYGYLGYWKSPAGFDLAKQKAVFPRLSVYGASLRGQAAGGIANAELAYYDSREDRSGDDPFTNNSQLRALLGYERDLAALAADLSLGMQYYLEWMMKHADYERALPSGTPEADEYRHVLTMRLRELFWNQTLALSLFGFYSPSDGDIYLRPRVNYKVTDHWTAEAGCNIFAGERKYTFFGQFAKNSNLYFALRYGFQHRQEN